MKKAVLVVRVVIIGLILSVSLSLVGKTANDPFVAPWEKERKTKPQDEPSPVQEEIFVQETMPTDYESNPPENYQVDYAVPQVPEEPPVRPELAISGLIWTEDGSGMVIIDDKIYKTGDVVVDNCVIKSIIDGVVMVKCEDNVWKYRVGEGAL